MCSRSGRHQSTLNNTSSTILATIPNHSIIPARCWQSSRFRLWRKSKRWEAIRGWRMWCWRWVWKRVRSIFDLWSWSSRIGELKRKGLLYYNESLGDMYVIIFLDIWQQNPCPCLIVFQLCPSSPFLRIWSSASTPSYDRPGTFGMIMSVLKKGSSLCRSSKRATRSIVDWICTDSCYSTYIHAACNGLDTYDNNKIYGSTIYAVIAAILHKVAYSSLPCAMQRP